MQSLFPVLAAVLMLLPATTHAFVPVSLRLGSTVANRAPMCTSSMSVRSFQPRGTVVVSMCTSDGGEPTSEVEVVDPIEQTAPVEVGEDVTEEVEEEKKMSPLEIAKAEKLAEIERLRAKEKFITQKTGDYECTQCAFVYKPNQGGQGALPGTDFEDLPSTWCCPVCRSPKDTFLAQTKTIAGFEDNLSYGLGANTLTSGQKNLLIFGGLGLFFLIFLAGYALE
ncbi:unnamed protein product [Choristocarpus tenellus]